MLKVLEVRPDGTAVVDTTGLYRVVIQPGNQIAEELLPTDEAAAFLRGFNHPNNKSKAEAITYPSPSTPSDEIVDEFCTREEAEHVVDFYNEIEPDAKAVAVPYKSAS